MDDRVNSPQQLLLEKPYKPKFHNAALYTRADGKPHIGLTSASHQPSVGSSSAHGGGASNATASTVPHYLVSETVQIGKWTL